MSEFIQVITTIDDQQLAQQLAMSLVSQRLAACCQIVGPVTSVYRWQGEINTATEWQLLIKSSHSLWPQLQTAIRAQHTYDVPEIIVVEISAGDQNYLDWWRGELE